MAFDMRVRANDMLMQTLEIAVPLHVMAARTLTPEQRTERAKECSQVVAEHGDDLLFGGKDCAEAFNRLAEGVALCSFAPGGVYFNGRHWETKDAA